MAAITIITPTYNRGELLERLYKSLLEQNNKDFCWLIIDDGSADNTEARAEKWKSEGKIDIVYEKQENGGKHRALNSGIKLTTSELTFIVDSDDYLPAEGIEIILRYHEKYKNATGICGYSFLRFYSNGEVNTAYFPKDEEIATYLDVRINGGIGGDKAEVFFTEVLKKYPFPEFEGERFLPEDIVWMQMSEKYSMVHVNECVYISDYLEGGLTKSGKRMKIHSPKGMMCRSLLYVNNEKVNQKTRVKMMLLYIIYGSFAKAKSREMKKQLREKLLYYLCFLPGKLIYCYWSIRFSE